MGFACWLPHAVVTPGGAKNSSLALPLPKGRRQGATTLQPESAQVQVAPGWQRMVQLPAAQGPMKQVSSGPQSMLQRPPAHSEMMSVEPPERLGGDSWCRWHPPS